MAPGVTRVLGGILKFVAAPFRNAVDGLRQEEADLGNRIYTEVRWQSDREAVEIAVSRMMTLKPQKTAQLQKALDEFDAACS